MMKNIEEITCEEIIEVTNTIAKAWLECAMMVWDRVKLAVEQMYKIYEEAGSPYGDESDDMYRWFIDLKDQEELKQKHAQQIIELRCKQLVREGFREKERTI